MANLLLKRIKDWATSITAFRTGDVIPVDGPSGTAKMSKDDLLKETAHNALAGNVAQAFDPTRDAGHKYLAGEKVIYDGSLYRFIVSHYGSWNASSVERISVDYLIDSKLDTGTKIILTGNNLFEVVKYFEIPLGCKNVSVKASPNPWPTDTIGGMNPNILILSKVDASGTITTLKNYQIGATIPSVIDLELDSSVVMLRLFLRANVGERVEFTITNTTFAEESARTNVGKDVSQFDIVGNNGYSVEKFIDVAEGIGLVDITMSPAPWDISGVTGNNPTILSIAWVDSVGTATNLVSYNANNYSSFYPFQRLKLPSGTKKIRFFFRATSGNAVHFVVRPRPINAYLWSDNDIEAMAQNAYRRGNRNAQFLVVADGHHAVNGGFVMAALAVKSSDMVDFILNVGDNVDSPIGADAYANYQALFDSSVPVLPVIGNHDRGQTFYIGGYVPNSKAVENVMKPAIDKGFIPSNDNGYYYKDFASRKLRVIVVNAYELDGNWKADGNKWDRVSYDSSAPDIAFSTSYSLGDKVNIPGWTDYSYQANTNVTTPASAPGSWSPDIPTWGTIPAGWARIGQTQMQWIADTLKTTPANYGVVIAMHTFFTRTAHVDTDCKFTFKGPSSTYNDTYWINQSGYMGNDVLAEMVLAFNAGESFSGVGIFSAVGEYSVTCDFSAKNTGAHFVGFVGGHFHKDLVMRHETEGELFGIYPATCAIVDATDIRYRGNVFSGEGVYHCNFTLISVDVSNNAFNLIKIGNKLTDDGYIRDCERIMRVP